MDALLTKICTAGGRGTRKPSLETLFSPRSVAIIGASNDPRRFGGKPIHYLQQAGYEGEIYPINPNRDVVQGLRAYPDIGAVDGPVECALISVSTDETAAAVEACAHKGVKSAIIFSAGFAEMGEAGFARQAQVIETARSAGMRVLGPNCMGAYGARGRFYGTFASALEQGIPEPGRIGLVSQSGGYGGYVLKHAFLRGLSFATWMTTGNEADVDVGEALRWMAEQDDVDLLVAYLEGLRNREDFLAALEIARERRKPVVVMKVGRTPEGTAAAISHTASLTGEDAVYDAVFREYGVHRARTTDELLDVTYAVSRGRLPLGRRVGVISISGGVGVQIADFVADEGLVMAKVPEATQAALVDLVPNASPRNPIDMTGLVTANHDLMRKTLDLTLVSDAFDAVVVFIGISGSAPSQAEPLRRALAEAYRNYPDRLVLVSVTAPTEMLRDYEREGLLVFEDPARLITALSALVRFYESFEASVEKQQPAAVAPWPEGAAPFDEATAKAVLAASGLRTPRERLVASADEAAVALAEFGGAVALKVVSPDILHKTEVGGVKLGIGTEARLREAFAAMRQNVARAAPDARISGYLVSEMVSGGVECFVGIANDTVFGPVVTFGLGGVLVELLKDVSRRTAPIAPAEAEAMVRELRSSRLLTGYRDGAVYDVPALVNALVRLSSFAHAHADKFSTIEVNPLVVLPHGSGVVALDAVIQT